VVAVLLLLLDLMKHTRMRARVCVTRRAPCPQPQQKKLHRMYNIRICTENRCPPPNRDAAPNVTPFCVDLMGTKARVDFTGGRQGLQQLRCRLGSSSSSSSTRIAAAHAHH